MCQSAAEYRVLIQGDLRDLIHQVIKLEQQCKDSQQYSNRRARLENKLYDLYQDIGWSVVYDIKTAPF